MDVLSPTDAKQFLFHYTSLEKTLEGILPGQSSLRLGRFTDTKDPYENREWDFGAEASGDHKLTDPHSRILEAASRLKSALRVACLTRDCLTSGEATPVEIRGFGLSRMWDRYGEGHRGICLALDNMEFNRSVGETIKRHHSGPIKSYNLSPPIWWLEDVTYEVLAHRSPSEWSVDVDQAQEEGSEDRVVRHHLAAHYKRFLFLKSKDWEGEREFRHVYWGTSETPELNVPITGALRGIFLGLDFPEVYKPALLALRPEGAVIYEMRWKWGQFRNPWVV